MAAPQIKVTPTSDQAAHFAVEMASRRVDDPRNSYDACRKHQPTMELVAAVQNGDEARVKSALARGARPKVTVPCGGKLSWCLVTVAANKGHDHLLSHLLQAGLSIEGGGTHDRTPLMEAAFGGHTKTVKALLALGANPSAKDSKGSTALQLAVVCGHQQCVAALIPVTPPALLHLAFNGVTDVWIA